jgi:hypothetical protein
MDTMNNLPVLAGRHELTLNKTQSTRAIAVQEGPGQSSAETVDIIEMNSSDTTMDDMKKLARTHRKGRTSKPGPVDTPPSQAPQDVFDRHKDSAKKCLNYLNSTAISMGAGGALGVGISALTGADPKTTAGVALLGAAIGLVAENISAKVSMSTGAMVFAGGALLAGASTGGTAAVMAIGAFVAFVFMGPDQNFK